MTNRVKAKTNVLFLFLSAILVAGTFATTFPSSLSLSSSFMKEVYALSEYEKDNVKCINFNLNVNGLNVNAIPDSIISDLLATQAQAQEAEEIGVTTDISSSTTSTFGNDENRFGSYDDYNKKKKDFAFVCINNNDNEQIIPPTPPQPPEPPIDTTETLTVIKNVDCLADTQTCQQNPIQPSQFNIVIQQDNNPSQTSFAGSSTGTNVEIEPGPYTVSEQGLDPTTPTICTNMGFEAGSTLGNNLFICTNFSDECKGDIAIGNPQTCTIDNVLVEKNFLDLAVANYFSNSVSILLGNGDGTFGTANNFAVGDCTRLCCSRRL